MSAPENTPSPGHAPAAPTGSGANRRAFLAGLGLGTAGVGGLVATAGFGWPNRASAPADGSCGI